MQRQLTETQCGVADDGSPVVERDPVEPGMVDQPVFLIGSERSGTTLLRLMLDHHPRISFQHEFEFVVDHVGDDGRFPDLVEYEQYLATDRIFQHSGCRFVQGVDYRALVNAFMRHKASKDRKPVIGATVHRRFDRLRYIWPDARYIHLIRDGRDVARSIVGMGWAGNAYGASGIWLEAVACWQRLRRCVPSDRWIEIRYENLVSQPDEELARLCDFLEVPFDQRMYDYVESSRYDRPDPGLSQQWKHKAPDNEIRLMESKMASVLLENGYELSGLEPIHIGPLRRIFLDLHSRIGRWRFRKRRYGLRLVLCDFVARRLRLRSWASRVRLRLNAIDARYPK